MKTEKELLDNVLKSIEELRKFHKERAEWCDDRIAELKEQPKQTGPTLNINAGLPFSKMKPTGPYSTCGSDEHTLCVGAIYCATCNETHPVGGLFYRSKEDLDKRRFR